MRARDHGSIPTVASGQQVTDLKRDLANANAEISRLRGALMLITECGSLGATLIAKEALDA